MRVFWIFLSTGKPIGGEVFLFFASADFWGVKEAPCKNLYVFGENLKRNQFPKLTTFYCFFHQCYNQGVISCATARPPVAASAGALSLAGSPSIRSFIAKSV